MKSREKDMSRKWMLYIKRLKKKTAKNKLIPTGDYTMQIHSAKHGKVKLRVMDGPYQDTIIESHLGNVPLIVHVDLCKTDYEYNMVTLIREL